MKRSYWKYLQSLLFLMLLVSSLEAKDILVAASKIKVGVLVGTAKTFTGVAFDIIVKEALPENVTIDRDDFAENNASLPKFEIRDADDKIAFELDRSKIGAALIKIQMEDNSPDVIESLSNQKNYIFINGPLRIKLTNGDYLVITPEVLKEATLSEINLSEENQQRLIAAKGGAQTLYQNKINFGMRADETEKEKKILAFDFSFSGSLIKTIEWWYFATKGYISTDKNDPISELHVFPITVGQVYGLDIGKPFETGEVRFYLGIEGEQTFKKSRLNGSFYYSTILPNLIDLTFGSKNRLRLMPVIKIGGEYWDEIKNDFSSAALEKGGKIGGEIYYYIPIMEKYSLLVEGNFGYTFGDKFKEKNNVDDFISQFKLTLGYEIPSADMKVLATYSFGQNNINFVNDTRLLLGLAIDLFSIVGK